LHLGLGKGSEVIARICPLILPTQSLILNKIGPSPILWYFGPISDPLALCTFHTLFDVIPTELEISYYLSLTHIIFFSITVGGNSSSLLSLAILVVHLMFNLLLSLTFRIQFVANPCNVPLWYVVIDFKCNCHMLEGLYFRFFSFAL